MELNLKVGELAKRTGLTVRTLHHWDEIGLLRPSGRTPSGHRLYEAADLARLHRIRSLRFLGFGLEDITRLLERPEKHLAALIHGCLAQLEEQIELARNLKSQLEIFARRLEKAEAMSLDEMMNQLELMKMYEKHYTKEQLAQLEARRQELGEEAIEAAQQEWPRLIDEVKSLREAGVPAADPRMRPLAARWMELVKAFTGGDPGIAAAAKKVYEEPAMQQQSGLDPSLFAYVREAAEAAGQS
jgi:DNA-binding transcriptional MerR regulator